MLRLPLKLCHSALLDKKDKKVVTRERPHPIPRDKLSSLGPCCTLSHLQKYNPGIAI